MFFFGTSTFAVPILGALAERTALTVVTQPDRPAGRGQKPAATPVKTAALEAGLIVHTPTDLRAFAAEMRAAAPVRCVVASYGRIVPQALLDAAPLWFNVHPSLLPLYRGATPIQSALRDGCGVTGVTIIAMDAGMDTGDILAQTPPLSIAEDETYGVLHDRLALAGAALLTEVLDADAGGTLVRTPQAEAAAERHLDAGVIARTRTRPWSKADTVLPADLPARAVVDRIRALSPKPGAQLGALRDASGAQPPALKLLRAHIVHAPVADHTLPGTLVAMRGALFIRAVDAWVAVDEVVPAGRGAMSMGAFANGWRVDAHYEPAG